MSDDLWKTKDGQVAAVEDMTDNHLLNTWRFLLRRAEPTRLKMLCSMSIYVDDAPDGAANACSAEADSLMDAEPEEVLAICVPQWKAIVAELKKRGLPKRETTAYRGPLMPRPAGLKR